MNYDLRREQKKKNREDKGAISECRYFGYYFIFKVKICSDFKLCLKPYRLNFLLLEPPKAAPSRIISQVGTKIYIYIYMKIFGLARGTDGLKSKIKNKKIKKKKKRKHYRRKQESPELQTAVSKEPK